MLVNNVDIKNFGVELLEKQIGTSEFIVTQEWIRKAYKPLILNKENKYIPIQCVFIMKAENHQVMEERKSNFLKALEECTLKFDDIEFYFDGTLASSNCIGEGTEKNANKEVTSIQVFFQCFAKYKPQILEQLNRILTKTINVPGNLDTPAIVEITPSIDIIDLIITGLSDDPITIRNLKAGKKVILNGEDSTVLQEGVNKFGDTDMWEFPRLKPGANTITVSKSSTDINIKYKPRWI